ncbi:MAG TPA: TRAP transporter small permease subunit [Ramlibacter sp.]
MKKTLELACGLLAGLALFAIMALTFFDVLGRKFASNSIPGSLELTELLMVVVIFGALPLVSERGEHVEFDSLDPYLPPGCAGSRRSWCTCCAPRCCWRWAG